MNRDFEHHQFTLRHLPVRFLKSAALAIPGYAAIAAVILCAFTLVVFPGEQDNSWWHSLTRWSITATAIFLGLICGGLLGFLSSARKAVERFHEELAAWFHQLPPTSQEARHPVRSLEEARAQYESLVERATSASLGHIPLPGFLKRLLRSKLRQAVVDDFIRSLEQRGVLQVSSQEFRNWFLTKGLSLSFEPTYYQLAFWRHLIAGLLGLFLVGLITVAYLSR